MIAALYERIGAFGLFALLAANTLTTMDGAPLTSQIVSTALLFFTALYFAVVKGRSRRIPFPAICLLLMTSYGVFQTLWFPQKIEYNGWQAVLFWLTASLIVLLAGQVFQNTETASRFRLYFVVFGAAVCILDLLEQASHTNKYFWLVPSRYSSVSGPFAYWNNFAQFIELLLPITLWMGTSGRRVAGSYLFLGALEIAAVFASGSRAGSALVLAEFLAILTFAYARRRNRAFLAASAAALVAAILLAAAAGFEPLTTKLKQRDQLAVRRDINASSLAMIRERPWAGWGLGSYVPVYPMFARYDDGTYVNRAHDDWLEWTAEGGVFFSTLMFAVFLWSLRPAIRSRWGIGAITFCIHATVDYPFARLGVCGWYFAMIGMLAAADDCVRPTTPAPKH